MFKRRSFWIGLIAGFLAGFLYGWFSIWATYTELEKQHRRREAELGQIKRIILYKEDILQQRKEILDWNLRMIQEPPEWAVEAEDGR